jgi:hypothetical protein
MIVQVYYPWPALAVADSLGRRALPGICRRCTIATGLMGIARQLHHLQEIDLELSANQRAQAELTSQLGESRQIAQMETNLEKERLRLEELRRRQHSAEWEAEDLATKLKAVEEKLFGGSIRNPKELANLQREAEDIRARRRRAEDRALETMGEVEAATAAVTTMTGDLGRLKAEWQSRQKELSAELGRLRQTHTELAARRQALAAEVPQQPLQVYEQLKARKGRAVARVEQGTCRGCQIALPTTDLQQVRGGGLVRCGSCGRILFLP